MQGVVIKNNLSRKAKISNNLEEMEHFAIQPTSRPAEVLAPCCSGVR
jgi:hypothetical protein